MAFLPPSLQWRNGEVRTVTFTVVRKELTQAQSGVWYARLLTSMGIIKAWKNTYDHFEVGGTYVAAVEGTIWNGMLSMTAIRLLQTKKLPKKVLEKA
jgi:hypothetical protein